MPTSALLRILFLCPLFLFVQCQQAPPIQPEPNTYYFPPNTGAEWERIEPSALAWNSTRMEMLYQFLEQKNTKAFIILYKGRIVSERYFGSFTADSLWYWASAGKTATALLAGVAQQEGLLHIGEPVSKYLGEGWTLASAEQERKILIKHQLSMSTGLNDNVPDRDCTLPACLRFLSEPDSRWAYHNAPYTLLEKVIEQAAGTNYNQYFRQKISQPIGMNGVWLRVGFNNVYFSNTRSMARFGLLLLNRGQWKEQPVLTDEAYFNQMIKPSQPFNNSYGYLTWLNGQVSHMLPIVRPVFSGSLFPQAPPDMYAALGRDDQKIYVVPSLDLVVVRLGNPAGNIQLAVSSFDNELWGILRPIIGY